MKLKTAMGLSFVVVIMDYLVSLKGDVVLFFVFVAIVLFLLLLTSLLLPKLICKTSQAQSAIRSCLLFFFLGGWAINHFLLPDMLDPISLLGNALILVFTIFLGFVLSNIEKRRPLYIGITVFVLIIISLSVLGSNIHVQSSKSSSIEALKSLPYLSYVVKDKAENKDGVVIHNQGSEYNGINLYNSLSPGAYLMDMSGNILHAWSSQTPNLDWDYAKIYYGDDLLVSIKDTLLMRLDWNSNIRWTVKMRSHHDVTVAENHDIYALARKDELVFMSGLPVPILNDYVVVLSPEGKIKKEISLFQVLKEQIPINRILHIYSATLNPMILYRLIKKGIYGSFMLNHDTRFDILHNNTITIIDRNINGLCKKGDILISVRQLDLIGIVDVDKEKLIWSWGPGEIDGQHHPTFLENGNILVFDNGRNKKRSRIIELDPLNKEIIWDYVARPPSSFFSSLMGAAQRLPNGNTLITESNQGHVFEITKDGKIVWEFYNPNRTNGKRDVIYRMLRITDLDHYSVLKRALTSNSW